MINRNPFSNMMKNKVKKTITTFIKKIAIGLTAVISSLNCYGMTVYADYDPCDVNHDNLVNMADALCINSYLNGNLYCPNYNQLDANRDLSVDVKDRECVQAKILQLSYNSYYYSKSSGSTYPLPTISGFSPDGASTDTSSRYYWKHSYVSNNTSSYSLTPSSNSMSISSINDTVDEINNEKSMQISQGIENTGIVRIGGSDGTGFIVGNHEIATAAHCVYNRTNGSWHSISIYTYNEDATMTGITLTPKECHIPVMYTSNGHTAYDYAVITVEENLSEYFKFNLGVTYNVNASNYASIPIYVTGCPQMVHYEQNGNNYYTLNINHYLYSDESHIVDPSVGDPYVITYYNSDSEAGHSGSPVYTIAKTKIGNNEYAYRYTVISILSGTMPGSFDCGSRITKYHLQFYKNNPNLSY